MGLEGEKHVAGRSGKWDLGERMAGRVGGVLGVPNRLGARDPFVLPRPRVTRQSRHATPPAASKVVGSPRSIEGAVEGIGLRRERHTRAQTNCMSVQTMGSRGEVPRRRPSNEDVGMIFPPDMATDFQSSTSGSGT
jgi:hypothetical protein